jgi:xylulokinase
MEIDIQMRSRHRQEDFSKRFQWRNSRVKALLGIDVGTSGTKVLVWDPEQARIVGEATGEHSLQSPHPGWAEQDPAEWWRATCQATRGALAAAKVKGNDVIGIGLSGQMHGSVFLDARNEVVRPCILWCDNRTAPECDEITRVAGKENLHRWVANPALPGFTAPKAVWLKNHEPENFRRTAHLALPKDFIRLRLTGDLKTEVSDAAGTILFDVENRRWCDALIERLGLSRSWFVPVMGSEEVTGTLTREAAKALGLREGTPVVGGGADNAAGAVGSGIVREGRVFVSLGSSGVVLTPTDTFRVDPQERLHTFCASVPGQWYLMGCMLTAGLALRWARDTLCTDLRARAAAEKADVYDLMMDEVAASPPGARGVCFLPHLQGERSPLNDPSASGAFAGLGLTTSRGDLLRALVEGITYNLRACLDVARELGCPIEEIRLTGGGANSPVWRQLCADVFDAEITVLGTAAGPALGAALLAGVGAGIYPNVRATEAAVPTGERLAPRPESARRQAELYSRWRALYPTLRPWMRGR